MQTPLTVLAFAPLCNELPALCIALLPGAHYTQCTMQPSDLDNATHLFREYRSWYGPPTLSLHGETIDGRVRLAALGTLQLANSRPFIDHVPHVQTNSAGEAAKYLCLAGHYDRARRFIPELLTSAKDIAAYCHCDASLVAPITSCRRPRARYTINNTIRRRDTINTLCYLLRVAEQSTGNVDAADLRKALSPWL